MSPEACGTNNLDLTADGSRQEVVVNSLPYEVVTSNQVTYLSCYYVI